MKVGDLVKIIRSPVDGFDPAYLGSVGVIVSIFPPKYSNIQDPEYNKWYEVSVAPSSQGQKGFMRYRIDYLEVISESNPVDDQ